MSKTICECRIGESVFYDGMADSVIKEWEEATSWYKSVAESDPHLATLYQHLLNVHWGGQFSAANSARLGFLMKQHRAAELKGEFTL